MCDCTSFFILGVTPKCYETHTMAQHTGKKEQFTIKIKKLGMNMFKTENE